MKIVENLEHWISVKPEYTYEIEIVIAPEGKFHTIIATCKKG